MLGASAAEKAQALVDAINVAMCIAHVSLSKNFANEWVGFKEIMLYGSVTAPLPGVPAASAPPVMDVGSLAGILKRTQALNERMRSHPMYTLAIGQDLGIIGAADAAPTQPTTVKAHAQPASQVLITYHKGPFAGVVIYSKRGAETVFTLLSIDTNTPYLDTRDPLAAGQPETRTYRLRLYDGDNPVGDYSDEVSVVTVP